MPELHGQPFKYQLRRRLNEAHSELNNERVSHSRTRRIVEYQNQEIAVLQETIQLMEQKTQELLTLAKRDIAAAIAEKDELRWKERRARHLQSA